MVFDFCSNARELMYRRHFLHAAGSLLLGCSSRSRTEASVVDAGPDGAVDAGSDANSTTPIDAAMDSSADANVDAASDAALPDAGMSDEELRKAQREVFPPWDGRRDSVSPVTMLMFRGNLRRNFHGTGVLPKEPVLKWKYRLGTLHISRAGEDTRHWTGTGWTGQAVKWGQRVFVGGLDGKFYCWDAFSGKVVWTLKTERMFKSSACFYDERLYIGNVDNKFRCIDARTGKLVWSQDMRGDCDSSPVVADGILYAASESGFLHALDPRTGGHHFKLDLGGHRGPGGSQGIESSPVIDGDELWIGTYDGFVYQIDRIQGKVLGKMPTGDDTDATPVVTDDYVFAAAEQKNPVLSCFERKTGTLKWSFRDRGGFWSTPAVVNGKVYIGGDDGQMYCLDEHTGKQIWSFAARRAIWASPSVVDGKVIFGSYDGFLYMVDALTGHLIWQVDLGGPVLSTACIVDGHIWIGSGDGQFYCFGPPNT